MYLAYNYSEQINKNDYLSKYNKMKHLTICPEAYQPSSSGLRIIAEVAGILQYCELICSES